MKKILIFSFNLFIFLSIMPYAYSLVDNLPPSAPSGLIARAISTSQINLYWNYSTDNIGITGYNIYRCQDFYCTPFIPITHVSGNFFEDTNLLPGTRYFYRIDAKDAAGNKSFFSDIVGASTYENQSFSSSGNTGIVINTISSLPIAPYFNAVCVASPGTAFIGTNIVFAGGQTGGKEPVKYIWTGSVSGEGITRNISFGTIGRKLVNLFVTDADGRTAQTECFVEIIQGTNIVSITNSNTEIQKNTSDKSDSDSEIPLLLEEKDTENTKSEEASVNLFLASLISVPFLAIYLLFLTLLLLAIIAYLIYTRRREGQY